MQSTLTCKPFVSAFFDTMRLQARTAPMPTQVFLVVYLLPHPQAMPPTSPGSLQLLLPLGPSGCYYSSFLTIVWVWMATGPFLIRTSCNSIFSLALCK